MSSADLPAGPFVAIDVETANRDRASICAIGLAWPEDGLLRVERHLVHHPGPFEFSHIHGLTAEHVARAPDFGRVWGLVEARLAGAAFVAAHNAGFDASAIESACRAHRLPRRLPPFVCTMRLARRVWSIRPTRLPNVCHRLGIDLDHHDAASDAAAAAQIVLAARRDLRRVVR